MAVHKKHMEHKATASAKSDLAPPRSKNIAVFSYLIAFLLTKKISVLTVGLGLIGCLTFSYIVWQFGLWRIFGIRPRLFISLYIGFLGLFVIVPSILIAALVAKIVNPSVKVINKT